MSNENTRGGKRTGAGRPKLKEPVKTYSYQLFIAHMGLIQGSKVQFVREAIRNKLIADGLLEADETLE